MRGLLLLLLASDVSAGAVSQEVPLKRCDRLFLVEVEVGTRKLQFLVDTGATSLLEAQSFREGESKNIEVTSWSGTAATTARAVTIRDMKIGAAVLHNTRLPAIDLSAIGSACGQRVDGVLGADLIEKLGATLDLKRRVANLHPVEEAAVGTGSASDEVMRGVQRCVDAFNRSRTDGFGSCIDERMNWFTPWGELRGRDAILRYLGEHFFSLRPAAQVDFRVKALRPVGEAYLLEYEYTMKLPGRSYEARGTAILHRGGTGWQLASMHNSTTTLVPEP